MIHQYLQLFMIMLFTAFGRFREDLRPHKIYVHIDLSLIFYKIIKL